MLPLLSPFSPRVLFLFPLFPGDGQSEGQAGIEAGGTVHLQNTPVRLCHLSDRSCLGENVVEDVFLPAFMGVIGGLSGLQAGNGAESGDRALLARELSQRAMPKNCM